jgi:hypothetical protein
MFPGNVLNALEGLSMGLVHLCFGCHLKSPGEGLSYNLLRGWEQGFYSFYQGAEL